MSWIAIELTASLRPTDDNPVLYVEQAPHVQLVCAFDRLQKCACAHFVAKGCMRFRNERGCDRKLAFSRQVALLCRPESHMLLIYRPVERDILMITPTGGRDPEHVPCLFALARPGHTNFAVWSQQGAFPLCIFQRSDPVPTLLHQQ